MPNDFQNTITKEFQKISLSILETLLLIICRNKLATNDSGSFHSAQRSLVIAGAAKRAISKSLSRSIKHYFPFIVIIAEWWKSRGGASFRTSEIGIEKIDFHLGGFARSRLIVEPAQPCHYIWPGNAWRGVNWMFSFTFIYASWAPAIFTSPS